MLTKVLVFESDPAFAGELRAEFANLGCTTTVVDDGNLGLQQAVSERPDLILLSIELPRMNGFSVCNKLKKDPGLKDVPLIIMSSESSDETFDQHKKLRTRAEDYVHKPIAFDDLLGHIRALIQLAPPTPVPEADASIVIEDEIEVGAADYLLEEEGAVGDYHDSNETSAHASPVIEVTNGTVGDADVDAFAETAFGRLTDFDLPMPASNRPPSQSPNGVRMISSRVPPPAVVVDILSHERLKGELAATRERLAAAENQLDDALRETGKLRVEANDSASLVREIEDLRAKIAAAPRPGGISSRDFLDLREALNKKDKDILALREHLSKKDREIVEAQDRALALERARADVEERLLGFERELGEARERADSLVADNEVAKKAADDLRIRSEKLKAEGDARERQLSEVRAKQAEDRAASEARFAAVRAESDQILANERAEQARALDQAEQQRITDLDQARRDQEKALAETREQIAREHHEGFSARLEELRQEHEAFVGAVRHEAALQRESALDALRTAHAEAVDAARHDHEGLMADVQAKASRERSEALDGISRVEAELSSLRGETQAHRARVAELEQRLAATASASEELERHLLAANGRIASIETALDAARQELVSTREKLERETIQANRSRAKAAADQQSLERAKDALAMALSHLEETETSPSE